jgi:lysophospholipase L1-like esterase
MKRALLTLAAVLLCSPQLRSFAADKPHDFAKWEKEIAAYESADRTNPPPKNAWLFIGSSTIRLWKTLAQDFPQHQVINRGFGGSEIVDSTHFAERIIFPYAPQRIFLRAGGNDIHAGKSPEQVFGEYKDFVAKVQMRLPETEIIFLGLSPAIARWSEAKDNQTLNQLVQAYAKGKKQLGYIETYDTVLGPDAKPRPELFVADKLHFNAEGYKLLTKQVQAWLAEHK